MDAKLRNNDLYYERATRTSCCAYEAEKRKNTKICTGSAEIQHARNGIT